MCAEGTAGAKNRDSASRSQGRRGGRAPTAGASVKSITDSELQGGRFVVAASADEGGGGALRGGVEANCGSKNASRPEIAVVVVAGVCAAAPAAAAAGVGEAEVVADRAADGTVVGLVGKPLQFGRTCVG